MDEKEKIPTLMIGLGGSGAKVTELIKQRLEENRQPVILIDTDTKEDDEDDS